MECRLNTISVALIIIVMGVAAWPREASGIPADERIGMSKVDPFTTEPPKQGPLPTPWEDLGEVTLNKDGKVWIFLTNNQNLAKWKTWTVVLTGPNVDKLKEGASAVGYQKWGAQTLLIKGDVGDPDYDSGTGVLTFTVTFGHQPKWEILELVYNGDNPATFDLDSQIDKDKTTHDCYRIIPMGPSRRSLRMTESVHNGIQGWDMQLTEFWMFPSTVPVDFTEPPTFTAPESSDNWSFEFVSVDPMGTSRPLGGVKWSTDGAGFEAGESYGMTFSMTDPADSTYTYFAYNALSTTYLTYRLVRPETIPTLSEWGVMIMTLLVLTAGTLVFGRRRRPAAA